MINLIIVLIVIGALLYIARLLPIYLGNHEWRWGEFVELHLGSMMGIPYLFLKGRE